MNLYHHYKNKPYKVHGVAKHSETLEDVVVYETLYENPSAKLWVRPKKMFEESIVLNGETQPRFAKINLEIEQFTQVEEKHIQILAPLVKEIFGEWDSLWFHSTFENHTKYFLLLALLEKKTVGFKLGYELDRTQFYSWLGGVLPQYRGIGIARDLMQAQHKWCKTQGYHSIQTQTQNRWKNQLILNIKAGFEIVGFQETSTIEGGAKILLEKKL